MKNPLTFPFNPSGEFDKMASQNLIDKMISLAIIPDIKFRSLIKTFHPILPPSGGHEKRVPISPASLNRHQISYYVAVFKRADGDKRVHSVERRSCGFL
jgi:hypothetical protein